MYIYLCKFICIYNYIKYKSVMRYKAQTQTKLDAVNNQLLSIIKGLDTHTLSATQVAAEIQQVRSKVDNIISLIELEPTDFGY